MKFLSLVLLFFTAIIGSAGLKFQSPIIKSSKTIFTASKPKIFINDKETSSSLDSLITYNLAPKSPEEIKEERSIEYIKKYSDIAKKEASSSGIPYSIIMAQALIESNAGISVIAQQNNNHFGQKCLSKTCPKGHCNNHFDDSHKDFFRIFKSVEESYHSHSVLLKSDRYKRLYDFPASDYESWAKGLQICGYATDKQYAKKLIGIIKKYNLNG